MKRSSLLVGSLAAVAATGAGLALFAGLTARGVEKRLPPSGRFIDIDGNRIHYLDEGEGPPILLVHGLGGQAGNFTYALTELLKDRFRVIVMERPGSGYSTRAPNASAGLGVQADVVAGFIRALGLEKPLLVGHSLGGALALATALQHPEVVGGLALLAPLTQSLGETPAPFRGLRIGSPRARRLVAWTIATPMAMATSARIMTQVFAPEPLPADFATRGRGLLALRPRAFYATSTDLMAVDEDMPGFVARYGELKLPVGVLYGADDAILDAEHHGRGLLPQLPGATYEAIEGAGHMIPVTRPKETADFIARMAERAGAGTAGAKTSGAKTGRAKTGRAKTEKA